MAYFQLQVRLILKPKTCDLIHKTTNNNQMVNVYTGIKSYKLYANKNRKFVSETKTTTKIQIRSTKGNAKKLLRIKEKVIGQWYQPITK